jgi:hypothetical protein
MIRAISHAPMPSWVESAAGYAQPRRRSLIGIIAFATTAVWALILYLASWAVGIPFELAWSLPVLFVIFVLLLLGLNMAAMASRRLASESGDEPPAA